MLFIAGGEGKGSLVRLRDKTIHRTYSLAQTHRFATCLCPTERVVAAFQARSSMAFFSPFTQQPVQRSFTLEQITACAVSSCGTYMVGGGQNGGVLTWNLRNGLLLRSFRGHLRCVTSIAFSSDGSLVVTASEDSTCKVWTLASLVNALTDSDEASALCSYTGHTLSVLCCTFLRNTNVVVTGAADSTCCLFDAATGERLAGFTVGDAVTAVTTSQDDRILVAGTQKGFLWFHPLTEPVGAPSGVSKTGPKEEVRFLPPCDGGHNSPLVFLKFVSPDASRGNSGSRVRGCTAGNNGSSGGPAEAIPLPHTPESLLLTTVLTASENGAVLWYDADSCKLIGEAIPPLRTKILSCVFLPGYDSGSGSRVVLPGLGKHPLDPAEKAAYTVERLAKRPRKESQVLRSVATAGSTEESSSGSGVEQLNRGVLVDSELKSLLSKNAELEVLRDKMLKRLSRIQPEK